MRKREKTLALKLLEKLHSMHAESVSAASAENNISKGINVLTECQNAAIKVGNLIEGSEGEGHPTVKKLEEYCELLYLSSEKMAGGEFAAEEMLQGLDGKLDEVISSLQDQVNEKKEVVFLPYKASMWDSLESVWKKACDDPNTDAYVIPIPYYDKNPDGSMKAEHYEGDQYPKYVPIVRYDEYDFEGRHPDEIYIHNPYDHNNYVTTVHPYFYSKELKKYTDKLIYIPYYVLAEPNPDDENSLEHLMPYVCQSGVVNADLVIVQSEEMKRAYVKCLTKAYGEDLREIFEEKIKGWGSPKFDRVLNAKREDQEIPAEWEKVLKKPDGSFKKVIMYNTGVSALINNPDKMLIKIKDSLKIFKENQDMVALIWRPHPLIMATIESMNPELLKEYTEIVENYKKEGWGIFDDTADMDRAIALSDAYYGDPSSIVQLYQKVEKPVMIQNVDVLGDED